MDIRTVVRSTLVERRIMKLDLGLSRSGFMDTDVTLEERLEEYVIALVLSLSLRKNKIGA